MSRAALTSVQAVKVVHLLAKRPELRPVFPVADAIALSVVWGA